MRVKVRSWPISGGLPFQKTLILISQASTLIKRRWTSTKRISLGILRYVRDAIAGNYVVTEDAPLIPESAQSIVNQLAGNSRPSYGYDNNDQ